MRRPRAHRIKLVVAALFSVALLSSTAPQAVASPQASSTADSMQDITAYSAAMDRVIPLTVLLPPDRTSPAPVLYLLNGAGGGEDSATWQRNTDVVDFFADKQVYVVIPMEGAFSYYTDWISDDPVLGTNKWSTFLGSELPDHIDQRYPTSGKNAIAGISSSATSVLNLAIAHSGRYEAVGSYSGCASSSSEHGALFIRTVVEIRGGASTRNMWGPVRTQHWYDNDPVLHADKLRGVSLYLSSASGLPGMYDTPELIPDPEVLADRLFTGGVIEAATRFCTEELATRLNGLNIPATVDRPATGTHSWPYWQDQLHKSWPQLARAIA